VPIIQKGDRRFYVYAGDGKIAQLPEGMIFEELNLKEKPGL
jgi:hypothetical protein